MKPCGEGYFCRAVKPAAQKILFDAVKRPLGQSFCDGV